MAPTSGGSADSAGAKHPAKQSVEGGPSVLFDAVALVVSEAGATLLGSMPAARDFVADAFAHMKFIGHVAAARPLLDKAGVVPDDGVIALDAGGAAGFVATSRRLRHWPREAGTSGPDRG